MEMYLLQLFISIWMVSGLCNGDYNCLTWTSDNTDISLICRLNNFLLPVSFIDPNEKEQAKCTFNTSVPNCLHHHKHGNIRADMLMHKVVFVIKRFNKLNVNGKWACTQGKKRFTTIVSTNKGLLETTNLYINGFIQSANNTGLKCFSCREPEWKSAEFLINNRTEDSLRYDEMSKQCFHSKGICHANTCSCSKYGNEFIRIFPVDIHRYETTFSCKMHFVDFMMSLSFIMIASVIFNGTDFIPLTTITNITKAAEMDKEVDSSRNETKTTVPTKIEVGPTHQFHVKWVAVVSIIFTMFFVIAFIIVCLYINKLRNRKKGCVEKNEVLQKECKNNGTKEGKEMIPLIEPTSRIEPLKTGSFSENLKDNRYMCNWCSINNRKTTVHGWCIDCDEFLCPECYKLHNKIRICKDHDVLDTKMLPHYFPFPCKIHQTEQLSRCDDSLFCEVCLGDIKQSKRLALAGAISDTIENSQAYNFIKTLVWCKSELDLLATHRKKHVESEKKDERRIKTDLDEIHERMEYQNQDDIPADIRLDSGKYEG